MRLVAQHISGHLTKKKKIGILNDVFPPHFQMFHSFLQSKKNEEKEEKKTKGILPAGYGVDSRTGKRTKEKYLSSFEKFYIFSAR